MSAGHIRPRGPGAWEIKYDVGADPLTGKRITKYKTVRGAKRDAQRELRTLLGAIDKGTYVDSGKLTLGAWLLQWLEEAQQNVSHKTHERYTEIVKKHLVPAIGAVPLVKLQPLHLQRYYTGALKSGRRDGKGGLSAQTVCHHDRVLNVALRRARALRLIATNPVEDVARPQVEQKELTVLDPDEATRLLSVASRTRLHVPIFLALATGVRRGELLALRWCDVALSAANLSVVQSLEQTDEGLRFKAPKTKRSRRTIALPQSAVEILTLHRAQQARERLQLGLGKDQRGLVFTQLTGEPVNPDNFSKEFVRLVKRAGIRPITFHGLRHTHATEMLRANVHPKVVSERLGHASVAITLDTYSHVVAGMQKDAAARIDASLRTLVRS
jgi:integrase